VGLDDARLLAFARRLQSASDVSALLTIAVDEIRETLGYGTAWIAVFDLDARVCRMLAAAGDEDREADIWADAKVLPIDSDPYVLRLLDATTPEIVVDAQTDPNVNRQVVEALGNRTVINVPMRLLDQPFGMLGTGSFGEEGVRVPSGEELRYLVGLAGQLVVASARILLVRQREDAARERAELERRLNARQRLESLGQLAGGVAHDFNNILTVILASASMLIDEEKDSTRRDDLQVITDAVERAAELTRQLLALGQRQPLKRMPTDSSTILRSLVGMLRRVIPADIAIDLQGGEGLPAISAESSQVEQVITNLCLNARDAMPQGGRITIASEHVTIGAAFVEQHPWARAGDYVLVRVTDSGTGMPKEVLDRIFEPFYTTKSEGRGTGLGLAVCRGIVEQHGGLLDVYSEVGVGSTFNVYLPVADGVARAADAEPAAPAPTGTERVLIADDQPHVRRVIERILTRAGYAVVGVANGRAAVEAAKRETFDLVMLDAIMPELGGRAAYEQIRQALPDVRVLFASGYGAEELTARFLDDTDVPLLRKPFDPNLLLRTVRAILDDPRGPRPSAT
jgi:signal transduction histidine kinase